MTFHEITGIIPAIVFPVATLVQLIRILRVHSNEGVSVTSWLLFGAANISIYLYMERYTEWQAIVSGLGTAALDFMIVAVVLLRNAKPAAVA